MSTTTDCAKVKFALEAANAPTPKLTTHLKLIAERKKMRDQHPDGCDTLRLRAIRKELKRRLAKRDTERVAIADALGIKEPSQAVSA